MTQKATAKALIDHHGTLYSEEIDANISRDTPQELFDWLICALMLSARISAANAAEGARALREAGLHKIDAIREADRRELVRVLNENGYARYDESTADYLRAAADLVDEKYAGDLRALRDAGGDREAILDLLQEMKGIGKVGAEIFAREAQLVWHALHPQVGGPAERAARDLGLPDDARGLAELVGSRERFVRLVAALTRAALDGPATEVREAAA